MIQAIRYKPRASLAAPARIQLKSEKDCVSAPALALEGPCALLVQVEDMHPLEFLFPGIENRGVKHSRKGLSRLLLGRENIQMIDGNYMSSAQIARSIYDLLDNAANAGECKPFIIGADPTCFAAIWERYTDEFKSPDPVGDAETAGVPESDDAKRLENIYYGNSDAATKVRAMILRVAASDYPVMIMGPSGTGKELVANQIHGNSRRQGPFVPINCGAIPAELLESKLFGHKKGAFTGAETDKKGSWETAHQGTLFLDEVGELSLPHQVKILRAIEEEEILPVGGTSHVKVDVRLISATHRNLFAMMRQGKFREDLYYRLHVLMIRTPAVGEHPEDIPFFVKRLWEDIIRKENQAQQKRPATGVLNRTLSDEVIRQIAAHPWPGNIRQLKNVLRSIYAMFWDIKPITPEDVAELIHYENYGYMESTRRISRISQNKRAEEVIQSARHSLGTLLPREKRGGDQDSFVMSLLKFHLDEFAQLCANPWLFAEEETFFALEHLRSKLSYFLRMLPQYPQKAMTFWKKEMPTAFTSAETAILQGRRQLKDSA